MHLGASVLIKIDNRSGEYSVGILCQTDKCSGAEFSVIPTSSQCIPDDQGLILLALSPGKFV